MGAIEDLGQKRKADAEKENPSKKLKGPSLKQIRADKDQSALFGMYLESSNAHELGEKFADSEQEAFDENTQIELAEARRGFLEITEKAKRVSEMLDIKSLQQLIDSSPELKRIADLNGAESIRDIVRKHLPEVAIRDPQNFEELSENMEMLSEKRKEIAEDEKAIASFCKKYGITQKEYMRIIEEGDTEELQDLVRDNMGVFKKFRAKFHMKAYQDREAEFDSIVDKDAIDDHLEELDRDLAAIGGSLQAALVKNETLARALTADLRGDGIEKKEPEAPFSEAKEFGGEDKDIIAAWEKHQLDHADEYMMDGTTRDEAIGNFSREYQAKLPKRKKGFWAAIGEMLFSKRVNKLIK
jgi:hypothetical protein